jgi:hypothetical protein
MLFFEILPRVFWTPWSFFPMPSLRARRGAADGAAIFHVLK